MNRSVPRCASAAMFVLAAACASPRQTLAPDASASSSATRAGSGAIQDERMDGGTSSAGSVARMDQAGSAASRDERTALGAGSGADAGSESSAADGGISACVASNDLYAGFPRCSTAADCPDGGPARPYACIFEPPSPGSGAAPPMCKPDSCASGQTCVVVGWQLECVVTCDRPGAAPCATGRCAPADSYADARGCAPPLCHESQAPLCWALHHCDPASPKRDANNCVRDACSRDADCPCGVCAAGSCYEHVFHCFQDNRAP